MRDLRTRIKACISVTSRASQCKYIRILYAKRGKNACMAVVLIVHGVLLDLDWSQIYRLSLGGLLVTMPAIFIALLTLEWIFDLS